MAIEKYETELWKKMPLTSAYSLQDISVELELAVPQELSNHLSAQTLPLQQEVGHSDGRVWDKPTCDQEVDASLWVPVEKGEVLGLRKKCVTKKLCIKLICA